MEIFLNTYPLNKFNITNYKYFQHVYEYRLPTDKSEAKRWVEFFQLTPRIENRDILKLNVRICEKHFENMDPSQTIHQRRSNVHLLPIPER